MMYNGLTYQTRQLIDAAAGGSLSNKYPEEAEQLFEDMASNESQWNTRGKSTKSAGIYEVNEHTTLAAKVDALARKFDQFVGVASSSSQTLSSCGTCGGGHEATQCPISVASVAPMEQVDFVSGGQRGLGNPYSSTYNQGWRNHPNFSWGQGSQQRAPSPPQQQAYQNASLPQKARNYTTEDVLARFMVSTEAKFETMQADLRTVQTDFRNLQASVKSIENQMGQLTSIVKTLAERLPGSLPSDTEVNPREHLKVITLRSGKELEERQELKLKRQSTPRNIACLKMPL